MGVLTGFMSDFLSGFETGGVIFFGQIFSHKKNVIKVDGVIKNSTYCVAALFYSLGIH